ncbi:MAG: hypothetical protein IMZ53_08320 [Thermoplasmata archaeon]|nr:hypothetical protein [Thermoplasmata archaeon]MBE3140573.1 hypothetical protein [Thermoplasmata archaeon]
MRKKIFTRQQGQLIINQMRKRKLKAYLIGSIAEKGFSENDIDIMLINPPKDWDTLVMYSVFAIRKYYLMRKTIKTIPNDWGGQVFVWGNSEIVNGAIVPDKHMPTGIELRLDIFVKKQEVPNSSQGKVDR